MEKQRTILKTIYDSKKSFYNKAEVETITTEGGNKAIILYSYKVPVLAIIETNYNSKFLYLNNNIDRNLLFSQTTLRHIKEALKQFYQNREYKLKDIIIMADMKYFDFLEVHKTETDETIDIATNNNYNLATSPETKKFFKGFGKYRETKRQDQNGKYLFTKSQYGYSNYYFYYIKY